jgi:hypothetical protein
VTHSFDNQDFGIITVSRLPNGIPAIHRQLCGIKAGSADETRRFNSKSTIPGSESIFGAGGLDRMTKSQRAVLRFPSERVVRSARGDATRLEIWTGRVRQWLGRSLNRLSAPGAIREMEFRDQLAGQHIAVSVGELFVCMSVNGRDYYFDRLTGRFDGTGSEPS